MPELVEVNFGAQFTPPRVTFEAVNEGIMKSRLEVDKGLQELGLPLSKKEAYDFYGRSAPIDEDDELKSAMTQQTEGMQGNGGGGDPFGGLFTEKTPDHRAETPKISTFDESDWEPHIIKSGPRKGQSAFKHKTTGEIRDSIPGAGKGSADDGANPKSTPTNELSPEKLADQSDEQLDAKAKEIAENLPEPTAEEKQSFKEKLKAQIAELKAKWDEIPKTPAGLAAAGAKGAINAARFGVAASIGVLRSLWVDATSNYLKAVLEYGRTVGKGVKALAKKRRGEELTDEDKQAIIGMFTEPVTLPGTIAVDFLIPGTGFVLPSAYANDKVGKLFPKGLRDAASEEGSSWWTPLDMLSKGMKKLEDFIKPAAKQNAEELPALTEAEAERLLKALNVLWSHLQGLDVETFAEDDDVPNVGHADEAKAGDLLNKVQRSGISTMQDILRSSLKRILQARDPMKADRLFDGKEMRKLREAMAETVGTAELLGRARVRERQAEAQKLQGAKAFSEIPTPFTAFSEPVPILPPKEAIDYFQSLVPTLAVDIEHLGPLLERTAFTMSQATSDTLLERVKELIGGRLESGQEISSAPRVIDELLEAAGVSPANPQYGEMVFRTNMMDAYNTGAQRELADPDVADTFPVWRYVGIRDGRQGKDHEVHFDKYYQSSRSFTDVRGDRPYNCRCSFVPVDKWEWESLQSQGVRLS